MWSRPVLGELATPPTSPVIGDRYLVLAGATGDWAGFNDQVAEATGSSPAWKFSGLPRAGQLLGVPSLHDALYFDPTNGWVSVGGEIHIGMFGVPNNKPAFPCKAAFQAAVDFCLANNIRVLKAPGNYYFDGTVDVSNFSYGFEIIGGGAFAHANFPANADWMAPQAFFRYGQTGGSMGGQRNVWQHFDGGNKAALWANSGNSGCGGSFFHCGYATNFIMGFYEPGGSSPHSSNKISGHYWSNGMVGILIKGAAAPAEGLIVEVAFITSCQFGGFLGLDGANFVIFGSGFGADYNGRGLSKLAVASLTGLTVGQTITCAATSNTGRIISVGTFQTEKRIIVAETKDVSGGNSNFANGQTITNGTNSTTISSAPVTADQGGNNIYFDVINGMSSAAPFSRWKYNGSYLGGVWSNLLYTDSGSWMNSAASNTNVLQGLMVTNNGAGQMTFYNRFLSDSTPLLDTTATLASFGGRDIYMPGGGISAGNVGVTMINNVTTDFITLPDAGANGSTWLVSLVCPGDANISGLALVSIAGGVNAVLVPLNDSYISWSISGRTVRAIQGTGGDRVAVVNWLRISLA